MNIRFTGDVYCPIARRKCPNVEGDTEEWCLLGESELDPDYGLALTNCTIYNLINDLAIVFDDESDKVLFGEDD